MDQILSLRPLFAVLVSMLVIPILLSSAKRPNVREAWTFVAGLIKFGLVVSMLPAVLQGREFVFTLSTPFPGVPIALQVDPLGMLFALVASFLWIFTSLYSIGYMRGLDEHAQTRFYAFFALALSSTLGVAFSANLFTLYLFYEILSLCTYPLVVHHQDQKSRISGRKYLAFILGTSVGLVLPGMLYCYHLAGTLDFTAAGILAGEASPPVLILLFFVFLFGFAKAGIMPFHSWLPAAMVAPTPVSALLHAVAVVKVGVFSIVRVSTGIFGVDLLRSLALGPAVATVASITILLGSLIALSQDELKRRLAFSTISQLSYIVLGIALLTPKGMLGGVLHIAMHAFGKITLFFCAGAIMVATGKKYISQMGGLGRVMPVTLGAFFIGSLSVIGLPPTGGFYSKWNLLLGAIAADHIVFAGVLLASSFLNAFYFLPIVFKGFFAPAPTGEPSSGIQEAPMCCVVPLVITALISIALFFYPHIFMNLAGLALS
ncbi:MAG: monovalent cation/H+ antiporter subunit D family protein [Desulfovermiculus sp.]